MAGPQCCVPAPPSLHSDPSPPAGGDEKEQLVASLPSYIPSPPGSTHRAVILVSDIFGYDAPLLRKLADKIVHSGYYAVVPDFLNKDPYVPGSGEDFFARFGAWIANHDPLVVAENAKQVAEALKTKGFSSIGIIGFCWGAKVAVQLAKTDLVKSVVLCHPSLVTIDDIQEVRAAIAILGAEIDRTTPPELTQKFADVLASKPEVESFVHVYPGVEHGWTCRYNVDDEKAVERANEAHAKVLEWFGKFL